jgi:hypothetical protein
MASPTNLVLPPLIILPSSHLHAMILRLLGLDHERRLTDVHGRVLHEILA